MTGFAFALRREVAHLARNRWDLAMVTLFPAIAILIVAAMLIHGVPRGLPVAIVDQDNSAFSRAVVRAVAAAPAVTITQRPADLPAAEALARSGTVWAILHVPRGASDGLTRTETPAIHILYNASFLTIGASAASGIGAAVQNVIAERGLDALHARGLPAIRIEPPRVQATVLFNPQTSFEWYLQALIHPAVLHLLTACVAVMAMGRELEGRSLARWTRETGGGLAALVGKFAPYLALLGIWAMVWMIWLLGIRGWTMNGSLMLTLFAQLLLLAGTAAISILLIVVTRKPSFAFSASALYAGSALAYSGGTLPLDGGSGFARGWSQALPFTHYLKLQMDQFLGAPFVIALPALFALTLYLVVPLAIALVLLRRQASA
ncbi:Multidrug ABC transporter permease [Sphingopyxis sp. LC81]|uniref:ABC transporter permease n=1 Tax=Sphingopyxis sp. LC81 TaxID=1502850 RepID=UPI00050E7D00|nr:ABC transporter permease [Sphingopyxis sp. LC81]KGB56221.1 Multidrug ABC transporter permease [Sphingopyxis sp. LC81]